MVDLNGPAVGLIIASIILVLILVFMILIVVLVRQCLAFLSKRNHIRAQMEQRQRQRENPQRRRGSVTIPVAANFDWHHSIKIAGTPPPSYTEAKTLPSFEEGMQGGELEERKTGILKDEEANEEGAITSRTPLTTTSAATGQTTSTSSGPNGVDASGKVTVRIDVENNPGEESRTFSTGYTEYDRASS